MMSELYDIIENHQYITGMSISDTRLRDIHIPVTVDCITSITCHKCKMSNTNIIDISIICQCSIISYAAHLVISSSVVGSVLVIISTFSY